MRLATRKYRLQLEHDNGQIAYDGSNCGGWTWDPPCGGCQRCLHDMARHYAEPRRRAFLWAKHLLGELG
ncbi:MAG TPA: hypothetical protein VFF53_03455 [Geobacteraceae bacterium]|nr:hypothetical protein [Geobacteraceae bacterium]